MTGLLASRFWMTMVVWLSLFCGCTLAVGQTRDALRQHNRAQELVRTGRPLEAIPIYEQLLRDSPGNPTLLVNLAVAHFKGAQYEATISVCRSALNSSPQLAAAWLFLGASYCQLQQPAKAIEPLTRAVELQPAERNARLMLGESLFATNRFSDASPHLEMASQLIPQSPRVWYTMERNYRALATEAESELEKRSRDSAWWHALAGDAAFRRRRYGLALLHYREALQHQPDIPGMHASIASLYRATEHAPWALKEEQLESRQNCTEETPRCAFRNGSYGECLKLAGSSDSGEGLYWRAKASRQLATAASLKLAALPPSAQLHALRARDLDELAQHREAILEWRRALKLSPADPRIERDLAVSLLKAGNHASALGLLEKLLERQPDSAELQLLCGSAYLTLGQPREALPYLRRAVELEPGSRSAQGAFGEALVRTAQYEAAISPLQAALAEDPAGTRHFQLALAYRATGQRDLEKRTLAVYRRLAAETLMVQEELDREYPITPP
ncbi:MAG: tetratricopeptide repeat protein [Acidobacteriota bacterium]